MIEVVAFSGALTDAGEHRQTAVLFRDVVDQFQHVHGLAHAGAAEQAHLAALGERAEQVDDLDAGFQQVGGTGLLFIGRRGAMDLPALCALDRADFIHRIAQHVHDAPERALADRHRDRRAGAAHLQAAAQTVRRAHGDGAHDAVAQLLLDFQNEARGVDHQGVVHGRNGVPGELDVHHGANDLNDFSGAHLSDFLKALVRACTVDGMGTTAGRQRRIRTPLLRRPRFRPAPG